MGSCRPAPTQGATVRERGATRLGFWRRRSAHADESAPDGPVRPFEPPEVAAGGRPEAGGITAVPADPGGGGLPLPRKARPDQAALRVEDHQTAPRPARTVRAEARLCAGRGGRAPGAEPTRPGRLRTLRPGLRRRRRRELDLDDVGLVVAEARRCGAPSPVEQGGNPWRGLVDDRRIQPPADSVPGAVSARARS